MNLFLLCNRKESLPAKQSVAMTDDKSSENIGGGGGSSRDGSSLGSRSKRGWLGRQRS